MTSSLYIHIPFCASKCAYCNFYSIPVDKDDKQIDIYLEALFKEIKNKINKYKVSSIPTLYIGGGSPSFIGEKRTASLLDFILKGSFASLIEKDAEITVEANPESLDEAFLLCCKKNGVNRISLGIQTFCDKSRNAVNRKGDSALLNIKLFLLKSFYEKNFSCDLISALPFQNEKVLLNDIETLLRYEPTHVSLYDLEPQGKIGSELPNDEKAALWIKGRNELIKNGFEHYEVSNFALNKNYRSRHNIRYWEMRSWLGAGKTASSTVIFDKLEKESAAFRETDGNIEVLDKKTLLKDTLLMGFRYIEGPDAALFKKRFGKTIADAIPETLSKWKNYVVVNGEKRALSADGLLFLDRFLIDAFEEIG